MPKVQYWSKACGTPGKFPYFHTIIPSSTTKLALFQTLALLKRWCDPLVKSALPFVVFPISISNVQGQSAPLVQLACINDTTTGNYRAAILTVMFLFLRTFTGESWKLYIYCILTVGCELLLRRSDNWISFDSQPFRPVSAHWSGYRSPQTSSYGWQQTKASPLFYSVREMQQMTRVWWLMQTILSWSYRRLYGEATQVALMQISAHSTHYNLVVRTIMELMRTAYVESGDLWATFY